MKKNLGLLAGAGMIWVGMQLGTQAYPIRNTQSSNPPAGINHMRAKPDVNDYYPRPGESYYYEQRVIIDRRGGYDNCYRCSGSSYNSYNRGYGYSQPYNRGPIYYPNSPYSIYNRYNRGY